METQLKTTKTEVEKLQHEKADLQSQLKFLQEKDQAVKENVRQEFQSEVHNLKQQNQALAKRSDDLESALGNSRKENASLRADFEKLSEVINQKISDSLDQAFLQVQTGSSNKHNESSARDNNSSKGKMGQRY